MLDFSAGLGITEGCHLLDDARSLLPCVGPYPSAAIFRSGSGPSAFSGASWQPETQGRRTGCRISYCCGGPSGLGPRAPPAGDNPLRPARGHDLADRSSRHCRARRAFIAVVPTILRPLPHIAVHVVEAPGVGWVGADLAGLDEFAEVVGLLGRRGIVAPPVARRRSRPNGVLPFRWGLSFFWARPDRSAPAANSSGWLLFVRYRSSEAERFERHRLGRGQRKSVLRGATSAHCSHSRRERLGVRPGTGRDQVHPRLATSLEDDQRHQQVRRQPEPVFAHEDGWCSSTGRS
jgi:hypothetical protein